MTNKPKPYERKPYKQFSREFKRLFGRSPIDETRHFKDLLTISPAAKPPTDAQGMVY